MTKPVRYSDINTSFSSHPVTKDITAITNDESVKQSIRNLIYTNTGEILYNSKRGSNIRAMLFELAFEDSC